MADALRKLGMAAALGTLIVAGGFRVQLDDHRPRRLQRREAAGGIGAHAMLRSQSAIGASEADVAKCHGPATSGNKAADAVPSAY